MSSDRSRIGRFFCCIGIHDEHRSQGVVGLCGRGCGDLKRWHSNGRIWTRYVLPPSHNTQRRPPPPPLAETKPTSDQKTGRSAS